MRPKLTTAIAVTAAVVLLIPAGAGAGVTASGSLAPADPGAIPPAATRSGEELVVFQTAGKLKIDDHISAFAFCGAPAGSFCQVTARITLKLPGPNIGPISLGPETVAGQTAVEAFLETNRAGRKSIRAAGKKAKFVTQIAATELNSAGVATGNGDTDQATFRFKR